MTDDTLTDRRQLTTFHLKIITLIAMLIDHIGWAFVETDSLTAEMMHTVGRVVAPMMAYFFGDGAWAYAG
ncbi:TraX family protein [Moraxella canis]|uniref:TraX family protein n=1 Tax=Moraxella canis TaxID=90239 RepID=UPI000A4561DC|nr:TraX family protein [Moraxella canis]